MTAQAMLTVALPYQPEPRCSELKRARYAAGKDYHHLFRAKLGRIGLALAHHFKQPWKSRAAVDSAPLNERTLARLSGLGWIGRNALLIAPDAGTYRLLGFLLTDAPLEPHHAGHGEDRCGSCTACERRCPTAALIERRVQTTRCISYLTIEHQGVIPRALAEHFEGWWFGCDLCQEVCPWNRFAAPAGDPRLTGSEHDDDLMRVDALTFDQYFAGRAMRRIGYERFRRNLLVAWFSLGRQDRCAPLIAEGLPLVIAQARELGLLPVAGDHPA
jgi:epoxyqueuosine reductase